MQYLSPIVVAYVLAVAAVLGLVMGSFVNCWAWRYARGESVGRGRSHCTSCGHVLAARDLVPVFSWLFSKGACRYCGQRVSVRYPLTELLCCAAFVGIAAVYGVSLETLELWAFAGILLFVSLVDYERYIIPNGALIAAVAVRIAYLAAAAALTSVGLPTRWGAQLVADQQAADTFALMGVDAQVQSDVAALALGSLASAVVMFAALAVIVLVADKLFKRPSMGGGDLKLYAVAGFYFGWQQGLLLVVVSCIVGIVMALVAPEGTLDAHYEDESDPGAAGEAPDSASGEGTPASARDDSPESVASGPASDEDALVSSTGSSSAADPSEGEDNPAPSKMKRAIPFGPSIAIACLVVMLVGDPLVNWYLGLVGL